MTFKKIILSLIVVITLAACGGGSSSSGGSASTSLSFRVQGARALMRGELGAGSDAAIQALVRENPQLDTIVMVDVPGSVDDQSAILAYDLVRRLGLNTEVPANGYIASGGVDFFVAGVRRRVVPGGVLGVHAWSDGSQPATEFPRSDPAHQFYISYYQRMGLPDPAGFYFFTIDVAPPEGIHKMSRAEIARYSIEN